MTIEETDEQKQQRMIRQRLSQLAADKQQILSLPPEKALDAILEHPQNLPLVHSMAEEDFFFLLHDIGPTDALELLSIASNRQWEFILDIEVWHRDRINIHSVSYWLHLLHQADPGRFIQWSMQEKYDLLEYYLNHTIELRVREKDEDPSDLGNGFFTFDDTFYIRFMENTFSWIEDDETREDFESFLHTLLHRIAEEDHPAFQMLLLRAANVMPGESEEEAYHFRNVRLAEKGFLPFDEAVGVYAPMKPETVKKRAKQASASESTDFNVPVPLNHSRMIEADTIFSRALREIEYEDLLNDIQTEFACLCNQVIAADQQPIREREQLRPVVNKACGFLSLGLHRIAGTHTPPGPGECAGLLRRYCLADVFRTGYGAVTDLKKQAQQWQRNSWFQNQKLALNFWGERIVGHIGGLLLKRPRFFDNYESGVLYRDFSTMSDVRTAEAALNEAVAFDRLLSWMEIDVSRMPEQFNVTYENLLLTLWAKNRLGQAETPLKPISVEAFRPFFQSLWTGDKAPARIKASAKSDFLSWLAQSTGFTEAEISDSLAEGLERLFAVIEDEYGAVAARDLDPRFVHLFILKPQ
ncbi:MAG: DUF6178 family protein [Thermodesulfobacteriota bacterium]